MRHRWSLIAAVMCLLGALACALGPPPAGADDQPDAEREKRPERTSARGVAIPAGASIATFQIW